MTTQKKWLSIVDYSKWSQLSISTVRRRIKSKKLIHKKHNGKYFILTERISKFIFEEKSSSIAHLKEENQKLKQEVIELKMLIRAYENKLDSIKNLPKNLSDKSNKYREPMIKKSFKPEVEPV